MSEAVAAEAHDVEEHHPSDGTYVKVFFGLVVITAIEVASYYVTNIPEAIFIAALIAMMLVKFLIVGGYFMHLKYDSKIFRRFFITGIVLAMSIYFIVLVIFGSVF